MRILIVDCDDSFTMNIYDSIATYDVDVEVINHKEIRLTSISSIPYDGIVLSPGPNEPNHIPILNDLINHYKHSIPILGICLGHQALGIHFGYELKPSKEPMHGISVPIICSPDTIFEGIDCSDFQVMRYNSLALVQGDSSDFYPICSLKNGEIMGCKHAQFPIYSFQFHLESIGTPQGSILIRNWVEFVKKGVKYSN